MKKTQKKRFDYMTAAASDCFSVLTRCFWPQEQEHTVVMHSTYTVLNRIKHEAKDRPVPLESSTTLSDGNCAYNSVALFLHESIANNASCEDAMRFAQLLCQHHEIRMYLDATESDLQDTEMMPMLYDFLKNLSTQDSQRILAPILRQMVVNEMRNKYDYYQNLYGEALKTVVQNNSPDVEVPYADTFLVHPFISAQCLAVNARYPEQIEQQQRAMEIWWRDEGFSNYLDMIERPALFPSDLSQWAGATELDILGKLFQCRIRYTKDSHGYEMLGDLQARALCKVRLDGAHWSYDRSSQTVLSSLVDSVQQLVNYSLFNSFQIINDSALQNSELTSLMSLGLVAH